MTFYYKAKQPAYASFLVVARTVTVFGMVGTRVEFWVFMAFHIVCVVLSEATVTKEVPWDAVAGTLLFLTFLMTFYNGHCYTRYMKLYYLCMDVIDGLIFFVMELNVSFCSPSVLHHRILATKYILALTHIFFIGITGGMSSRADWNEIMRRGLLSEKEAKQLARYPARSMERVLLLSTWTMQVCDIALQDDHFWGDRSMRIAHTHNRLEEHITLILHAIHEIEDILALPIPFPYYHIMNVVMLINLIGLGMLAASYHTYMTMFPYAVAVGFFMGLREVSTMLADPFRGGDSDFPVESFLQYVFDHAVCLLEAFRHEDPEQYVSQMVKCSKMFTNPELAYLIPFDTLYTKHYDQNTSNPFSWNKETPLQELIGTPEGPAKILESSKAIIGELQSGSLAVAARSGYQGEHEHKRGWQERLQEKIPFFNKKKKKAKVGDARKADKEHLARSHEAKKKFTDSLRALSNRRTEKTPLEKVLEAIEVLEIQRSEVLDEIAKEEQALRDRGKGEELDRFKQTGSIHQIRGKVKEGPLRFSNFTEAQELILSVQGRSSNVAMESMVDQ